MGRALLWIFGTAFAAAALTLTIGLIVPELTTVNQREGAYAMGLIFIMTPAAFVAGAVAGLLVWLLRR